MPITLTCIRCGSLFAYEGSGRRPSRCSSCRAIHKRENAARRQAKWRRANHDKYVAYLREYHQARKDDPEYRRRRREAMVFYTYGITPEELDALIEKQGGRCVICSGPPNGPGTRLHIDHCHQTGRVRGLLCAKCNTMIGLADNDPCRLRDAADYLKE